MTRTPLQVWTRALFSLLEDARDELDETAYTAFLFVAGERLGIEASRLVFGEALRAVRRDAA